MAIRSAIDLNKSHGKKTFIDAIMSVEAFEAIPASHFHLRRTQALLMLSNIIRERVSGTIGDQRIEYVIAILFITNEAFYEHVMDLIRAKSLIEDNRGLSNEIEVDVTNRKIIWPFYYHDEASREVNANQYVAHGEQGQAYVANCTN
jgi:hypothetical protein